MRNYAIGGLTLGFMYFLLNEINVGFVLRNFNKK